eukprot:scaffold38445_cov160-Amphora_coffeaeformis.AAC.1
MEVAMLAEESLYCCSDGEKEHWDIDKDDDEHVVVDLEFVWEYATAPLRRALKKQQQQEQQQQQQQQSKDQQKSHSRDNKSSSILRALIRHDNPLVVQRFAHVRSSYRDLLRQGYRRPLMATVIANLRFACLHKQRTPDAVFPLPDVAALVRSRTSNSTRQPAKKKQKRRNSQPDGASETAYLPSSVAPRANEIVAPKKPPPHAPVQQQSPPEQSWLCHSCTLLNKPSNFRCEACQIPKKRHTHPNTTTPATTKTSPQSSSVSSTAESNEDDDSSHAPEDDKSLHHRGKKRRKRRRAKEKREAREREEEKK